jgi:DNA-binding HxlR family transcriptional regulator
VFICISNARSLTKSKKRSDCPLSCTLEIVGDKWSLLILRDIILLGKSTYGDFANSNEKIASNILADRLKHLCSQNILEKNPDRFNKLKFHYTATQKGLDLHPVIIALLEWGTKYFPELGNQDLDEASRLPSSS